MADDVGLGKMHGGDTLHVLQHLQSLNQTGPDMGRQVDLGHVARDHGPGAVAQTGQEHLHLLRRGVLSLVENDKGVVQSPAAHKGQGGDLNGSGRDHLLHLGQVEHVVQGVVERTQIGVDLLDHVAGQESELFPGFHRRPGQDQTLDPLLQKHGHADSHGQIGLARAGRTHAQGQIHLAQSLQVFALDGGLGANGLAAGDREHGLLVICLERCRRVAQHDAQALFDVAVKEALSAPDQVVNLGEIPADQTNHDPVLAGNADPIALAVQHKPRDRRDRVQMRVARTKDLAGQIRVVKNDFLLLHASSSTFVRPLSARP